MLLTFLWIAGLTNAYNVMDGIGGIAEGQAVIAGVVWIGLAMSTARSWAIRLLRWL